MDAITRVLSVIEHGDPHAAEQLLPLVYDELRKLAAQKLAHEKPGQTLQATALVHEAYLRLVGTDQSQPWDSRAHFLAAAAEAMRRILIENARRKMRVKHGGQFERVDFELIDIPTRMTSEKLLALDDALVELGRDEPRKAQLGPPTRSVACVTAPFWRRRMALATSATITAPTITAMIQ